MDELEVGYYWVKICDNWIPCLLDYWSRNDKLHVFMPQQEMPMGKVGDPLIEIGHKLIHPGEGA